VKPTKRYDRIWDDIASKTTGIVYTEVLWSQNFGGSWITTTQEIYDKYLKSGIKYFSDFVKKENITSVTLPA